MIFFSCQKVEMEPIADEETPFESAGMAKTLLGKKLENPYSVTNMRKALESFRSSDPKGREAADFEIEATHYYVRLFTESDEQLLRLEKDSLYLFDYPLDYEIDSLGDYYMDPEVDPEEGKWYYTSVPVDYRFPDIQYEILEELFLLDEEDTTAANGKLASLDFLYELEEESLRLTGNLKEPEYDKGTSGEASRAKIHPQGYVRVWDTERRKLVGVEGVKVRTRRWFKYGRDYTNSLGYYRIDNRYKRDVHYTVFFENASGFKIWSSTVDISKASHHVGKHSRYDRNIDMYTDSRAWRFATVNNAAVKYRNYCGRFGIGLPPSDLRIVASDGSGGGAAPMLRRVWGFYGFTSKSKVVSFLGKVAGMPATILGNTLLRFILPDIIVKANSAQGTAAVYETAFHELAHASHYAKVGNNYWIRYINYIVTYGVYGDGTGNNAGLCALGEAWGYHMGYRLTLEEFGNTNSRVSLSAFENFDPLKTGDKNDDIRPFKPLFSYWNGWIPAGIMYDIIDTNRDWLRSGFYDDVAGYTHKDLFNALDKDVDTPQKFRDRLLKESGNLDRADLENLFEAYYWK
ncbi:hypothetical protein DN752_08875 [Echinicola strongylocentroti]|uniref:Uncharacterized protein n=2 Tax=Echinicola strongylocentroti TaxID=1795355 RepID=A0A2Z4IHQ0_9BACT|nr:hypothetical protein DN752_08875 [Echinicola strongylocentroti]